MPMNLKVLLPFRIFTAKTEVTRIVAETRVGSFGLLPHRLDCIAPLGPGILALSFHSAESGRKCDPEWGFESDVGHSVLILKSHYPAELAVFDPAPEYGFEVWDEDVLANMRKGILLRLVRRDGTQAVVQFDLNALKQDSSAYPSIVRR